MMSKGSVQVTRALLVSFIAVLLVTPAVLCSEGGHGAAHGSIADLGVYWVNFLIYAAIMFFVLRKPALNGWTARRNKIESDVIGGRAEIEAAETKIAQMRSRMELIGEDIERLREATEKETERESRELVESARVRAQRISQRMREACSAEQRAAEDGIRSELAELAVKMAREQLTRDLNVESDKPYRDAVVNRAGGLLQ